MAKVFTHGIALLERIPGHLNLMKTSVSYERMFRSQIDAMWNSEFTFFLRPFSQPLQRLLSVTKDPIKKASVMESER